MTISSTRAAVLALGVIAALAGAPVAQAPPTVGDLLVRYDRGEYAPVAQALAQVKDSRRFRRDLSEVAYPWIAAGRRDQTNRRRLVAAGLALEAGAAGLNQWQAARHLVEWGCALLREGPPTPLEETWQLAAVALIERARDAVFLVGLPPPQPDADEDRGNAIWHLDHVERRFPHSPRFALARAEAEELKTFDAQDPPFVFWVERSGLQGLINEAAVGHPITGARMDPETARELVERAKLLPPARAYGDSYVMLANSSLRLFKAAGAFNRIRQSGPVAVQSEAALRQASVYIRLAKPNDALAALKAINLAGAEPFIQFLAHYFNGRILEQADNREAAVASYRLALEVVPRAESASLSLSALLFTGDGRDEAVSLVDAALGEHPPVQDPWRSYAYADYRFWPELIAQLHEGLR